MKKIQCKDSNSFKKVLLHKTIKKQDDGQIYISYDLQMGKKIDLMTFINIQLQRIYIVHI